MRWKAHSCLTLCFLLVGCNPQNSDRPGAMALPISQDEMQQRSREKPTSFVLVEPGQVAKTTYEASLIDTTKFANQIWRSEPFDGDVRDVEGLRGGDTDLPRLEIFPPNDLSVDGDLSDFQRIHKKAAFPGIDQSFFTPPDPTLAAGPEHIVEMVNSGIAFFTEDGDITFQAPLGSQGDPGFFDDVGSGDLAAFFTYAPLATNRRLFLS